MLCLILNIHVHASLSLLECKLLKGKKSVLKILFPSLALTPGFVCLLNIPWTHRMPWFIYKPEVWSIYIVNLMLTPGLEGRFHHAAWTVGRHPEWGAFGATGLVQTTRCSCVLCHRPPSNPRRTDGVFQRSIHLIYKPETF